MSNANAQVVGYVGSSICNLFKLAPHLDAQGYNVPDVMRTVMAALNDQLDHRTGISNGQNVDIAASHSAPNVGAALNSDVSVSLR